jgi:hypothetical protein
VAIRTKHLIGRGSLAGLGCYFRVFYSLEHIVVVAPEANMAKEAVRGVVEPPLGVSLPVGKAMALTLEDGSKIRIIADGRGEVIGVGPFKLPKPANTISPSVRLSPSN